MDVEYTAVCRGLTSGRIINITGRWTGVNVQETDAVLDLTPINGGAKTRTILTKEVLKSQPIRVK